MERRAEVPHVGIQGFATSHDEIVLGKMLSADQRTMCLRSSTQAGSGLNIKGTYSKPNILPPTESCKFMKKSARAGCRGIGRNFLAQGKPYATRPHSYAADVGGGVVVVFE
jgi:hypothetical protein